MKILLLFALLWSTVALAVEPDSDFDPEKATAKEITAQMANVYKNCKSYFDTGIVKTTFFMQDRRRTSEKPFSTAFVRPDQFRFEYTFQFSHKAKLHRYIVWAKGKESYKWWSIQPGIKKTKSLLMAIAGATGVSGGSAHTVPVLLMPELGGRSYAAPKGAKRIEDAMLNNIMCYRVLINYPPRNGVHSSVSLWISKKTFLLLQINGSTQFPKFRTETVTSYKPELNIDIPENDLAFNAPEKNKNQP